MSIRKDMLSKYQLLFRREFSKNHRFNNVSSFCAVTFRVYDEKLASTIMLFVLYFYMSNIGELCQQT